MSREAFTGHSAQWILGLSDKMFPLHCHMKCNIVYNSSSLEPWAEEKKFSSGQGSENTIIVRTGHPWVVVCNQGKLNSAHSTCSEFIPMNFCQTASSLQLWIEILHVPWDVFTALELLPENTGWDPKLFYLLILILTPVIKGKQHFTEPIWTVTFKRASWTIKHLHIRCSQQMLVFCPKIKKKP